MNRSKDNVDPETEDIHADEDETLLSTGIEDENETEVLNITCDGSFGERLTESVISQDNLPVISMRKIKLKRTASELVVKVEAKNGGGDDDTKDLKWIKTKVDYSGADKRQLRAARFGDSNLSSEDLARKKRMERFGIIENAEVALDQLTGTGRSGRGRRFGRQQTNPYKWQSNFNQLNDTGNLLTYKKTNFEIPPLRVKLSADEEAKKNARKIRFQKSDFA